MDWLVAATYCEEEYGISLNTKEGYFDYYQVEEMEILAVSLVTTPANGNPLEKAKEIKNTTQFIKRQDTAAELDEFAAMFN